MSHDHNLNKLSEYGHGQVHSEGIEGHEGTNYEGTDASVKIVLGSLIVIVITLVVSFIIVLPIQNVLKTANPPGELPSPIAPARVVPTAPVLQVHPWETFPDLVASQNAQLTGYGKDVAGHVHVPIEKAIDGTVAKLNVRPNAPQGYTVPGGQGREFAASLASMPPAYQTQATPTIQGEIRKNAQ